MQACQLRKYGVETTINFELYEVDGVDLRVDAVDGGTDCTILRDNDGGTTCVNDFSDEGVVYSLTLTALEMQAASIVVYVVDSATKVYLDKVILIETYGHVSAQHAVDLDDGVRAGLTALPNAAATAANGLITSVTGSATNTYDGLYAGVVTNASGADVATDTAAMTTQLAGITVLGDWLRLVLRDGFSDATALSEINTGGTGAYNQVTDSQASIGEDTDAILEDTGTTIPATLTALDVQIETNRDLAQHLRGFHTHQGNTFYVAPVNGNDSSGDGSRALPYKTLQNAIIDLITDSNHDTIIVLADAAAGVTTHTSTSAIDCNKRYFSILGPGRDAVVTRSNNGPTFTVTADGIEISGFQIGSDGNSATSHGVSIAVADFHRIHNCWFLDTQGDGIRCQRGSNCQFHDNHFEGTGIAGSGQGIHVLGTGGVSNDNAIFNNHFAATAGDSVLIEDGTTNDTTIHHNMFHNATGWGVNISGSSTDAQVYENTFGNNSAGNIQDNGITSIIKNNTQWIDSTVEGRSLDVTATGAAGIDWGNVENKTSTVGLTNTTIAWNSAWDAEVESEATDALVALNLDHLMKTAVANNADMTVEVPDGTVLSNVMSKTSDTSTFVVATDSLEGLSDGAAGGGATAAEVWAFGTRVLTANTNLGILDAAATAAAVWSAAAATYDVEDSFGNIINDLVVEDSGGVYQFTANTLELGPTVAAASVASQGAVNTFALTAYQHARLGPFIFTADVAQTGDSHVMTVFSVTDPPTIVFEVPTGNITVSGAGDVTLTVAQDDTNTATANTYRYILRNTTDDTVIAVGTLEIIKEPEAST